MDETVKGIRKFRYRVLTAEGRQSEYIAEMSKQPTYDEIKAVVEPYLSGGQMEYMSVLRNGERADMFIDETGLQKRLPRNAAATAIYRANWLRAHPSDDPESLPFIPGDVVIFDDIVMI